MEDLTDNWKNRAVFEAQLELNTKQLSNPPEHWLFIKRAVERLIQDQPDDLPSLLDVGCGCGAVGHFLRSNILKESIYYHGIDYAEEAIEIAKANFAEPNRIEFSVRAWEDYLPARHIDMIIASNLTNIMSNGDACLEHLLKHKIYKVVFTGLLVDPINPSSVVKIYKAYDKAETYRYVHNVAKLLKAIEHYDYEIEEKGLSEGGLMLALKHV